MSKWQKADILEYGILKQNAKDNRNNMTEAESAFWSLARGSGLGEKCRRQYVIGDYIVDFFFRKSMLIVEIDGEYHFTENQQREDIIRQEWLTNMGYRVLRFSNKDVLFDTETTIERIKNNLYKYET